MAEKTTVIITVDLNCSRCSNKIKKALCKLQKQFNITSITFDEKKNTILVSGPFNPDCFIKKICCIAHKVIKDIQVQKPQPQDPKPQPLEVVVNFPWTVPTPIWPVCCHQPCPCYESHHGYCRRCSRCWVSRPCCESGGLKIVCEDEPYSGCSIM